MAAQTGLQRASRSPVTRQRMSRRLAEAGRRRLRVLTRLEKSPGEEGCLLQQCLLQPCLLVLVSSDCLLFFATSHLL
jgi:hypothetical protein